MDCTLRPPCSKLKSRLSKLYNIFSYQSIILLIVLLFKIIYVLVNLMSIIKGVYLFRSDIFENAVMLRLSRRKITLPNSQVSSTCLNLVGSFILDNQGIMDTLLGGGQGAVTAL